MKKMQSQSISLANIWKAWKGIKRKFIGFCIFQFLLTVNFYFTISMQMRIK